MRRAFVVGLLLLTGCTEAPGSVSDEPGLPVEPAPPTPLLTAIRPSPPPTFIAEMPPRLVALGDLHGDFNAMIAVLQLAGLIDTTGAWSGGTTVAVQTGDQLDRGPDDRMILDFLELLTEQAWLAGGALYVLNGNHETMNVDLDFRYVDDDAWLPFDDLYAGGDAFVDGYEPFERGRVAAFRPGGDYARLLAEHNSMMQIGDTVFVHGGVLPAHVGVGLENMNATIRSWMLGEVATGHEDFIGGDGPLWVRNYSDAPDEADCQLLTDTLELLGASRMVVAHTVQLNINPDCDGKVWRIDVGMSAYYGGIAAALEIVDGQATVLQ